MTANRVEAFTKSARCARGAGETARLSFLRTSSQLAIRRDARVEGARLDERPKKGEGFRGRKKKQERRVAEKEETEDDADAENEEEEREKEEKVAAAADLDDSNSDAHDDGHGDNDAGDCRRHGLPRWWKWVGGRRASCGE